MSIFKKLTSLSWSIVFLLALIVGVGILVLYSAADGNLYPWSGRQALRFLCGFVVMILMSLVDVRIWLRYAYIIYGISLCFLFSVEVAGFIGMGAQRWIDLYLVTIQPSELMKLALVLALARYLHIEKFDSGRSVAIFFKLMVLIGLAVLPVVRQPDLGTAVILLGIAGVMLFGAGVRLRFFVYLGMMGAGSLPLLWKLLHEYQKKRVLIFFDPNQDPLGAGYHVLQSQIALGSGGMWGKGFLAGTQSHLDFLPEKQTDFIFTMLCEEFGFVGGLCLLGLYILTLILSYRILFQARYMFSRMLILGVLSIFFIPIFINMGMVMGILPVVGVPLPLVSYGGSALLTILMGFGLLFSMELHQDVRLSGGVSG